MGEEYVYDEAEHDTGHRPQSRASQHSSRSIDNNGYGNNHRLNQRQGAQHDPQQVSSYAYQRNQFDEPDREEEDDMW